jgi:hypothetical protein
MNNLFGIQIIEDVNMVDSHSRAKTWRERWLSWPWRPWVKTVVWYTPSETIYLMNTGGIREQLICHPKTTRLLEEIGKAISISALDHGKKGVGEVDVIVTDPQPGEEWQA